jgi:O-antigen ligase/polysaccharide polymerase Wzy-like membrane protein
LGSAGSVASAPSSSRFGARAVGGARFALAGALVAVVAVCGRAYGGYEITVWGPLGLGLVLATGALLATARRPRAFIGASALALVALGGWSALSTTWGGLPDSGWEALDQTILAAAALVFGSVVSAGRSQRRLVVLGVLAGIVAQAIEVLVRLATGHAPDEWFLSRFLEGPVGYHNAQAAIFVLGLPLALWLVQSPSRFDRAAGGAAAGLLIGSALLTQSRAALAAGTIAVIAQLALSRNVRISASVLALAAVAAALLSPLRDVDAVLVGEASDAARDDALSTYALWTAFAAVLLAVAAAPDYATRRGRRAVAVAAALTLVVGIAALAVIRPAPSAATDRVSRALDELTGETDPDLAPPGRTRLTSVSLNGRWNAWNVAWDMAAESPVTGAGQGRFTGEWAVERELPTLYLLQPHSLELEVLAELGVVGLALLLLFVVLVVAALRRAPEPGVAIAAFVALFGVLLQASVDWTWSFPGLIVPTLMVAGAAAGAGRRARPRFDVVNAAVGLIGVAALVSILLLYLSAVHLERARAVQTSDVSRAWTHSERARALDPWDPEVLSLQGRLAEAAERYPLAAARYRAAARLSRRPWLEHYYHARALNRAGNRRAAKAACRRAVAANPQEDRLRAGVCRSP